MRLSSPVFLSSFLRVFPLFAVEKKRYTLRRMVARLTVILFIFLSLLTGICLILLPWVSFGIIADWGDNFLLASLAQKTGLPLLQKAVASGWVRGAVTGLGILNLFIAFWEIAHFSRSVRQLEGGEIGNSAGEKR